MDAVYANLIGIAVQTAIFLLGGYGMVIRNDAGNKQLRQEITNMQLELKKLAEVIVTQAVQTTRLDNLLAQISSIERRVEEMRRGKGFVENREGRGRVIDGEY